jgi:hypothetical protein
LKNKLKTRNFFEGDREKDGWKMAFHESISAVNISSELNFAWSAPIKLVLED